LPAGLPGGASALFPVATTFTNLTAPQATFVNTLVTQGLALMGSPATFVQGLTAFGGAVNYAYLASTGGNIGLSGRSNLVVAPLISTAVQPTTGITPIAPGGTIGGRFLLTGAPVPVSTTNAAGQLIAFRPLQALQTIFPVTEKTTFNSFRLDQV